MHLQRIWNTNHHPYILIDTLFIAVCLILAHAKPWLVAFKTKRSICSPDGPFSNCKCKALLSIAKRDRRMFASIIFRLNCYQKRRLPVAQTCTKTIFHMPLHDPCSSGSRILSPKNFGYVADTHTSQVALPTAITLGVVCRLLQIASSDCQLLCHC